MRSRTSLVALFLCVMALTLPHEGIAKSRGDRLETFGRLWTDLRLFYPQLSERSIDWDGAYAAGFTAGGDFSADKNLVTAVERMLAIVDDPVTRVIRSDSRPTESKSQVTSTLVRSAPDGTLVLDLSHIESIQRILDNPLAMQKWIKEHSKRILEAQELIVDIRNPSGIESARLRDQEAFLQRNLDILVTGTVYTPSIGTRVLNGLPIESGVAPDLGYSHGVFLREALPIEGRRKRAAKITIVLDDNSQIPQSALLLRSLGSAAIVCKCTSYPSIQVPTKQVKLTDTAFAQIRLGRLFKKGLPIDDSPDAMLPPRSSAEGKALIRAAWMSKKSGSPKRKNQGAISSVGDQEADNPYPSTGQRALAATRLWGNVMYFFPYLSLSNTDWEPKLPEIIESFVASRSALEYHLAVLRWVAKLDDSHARTISPVLEREFFGPRIGLELRWIESSYVVTKIWDERLRSSIQIGDQLVEVNGEAVSKRVAQLRELVPASTEHRKSYSIGQRIFFKGGRGSTTAKFLRTQGQMYSVDLPSDWTYRGPAQDSEPGIRWVLPEIAYLDMGSLYDDELIESAPKLKSAKTLIIDLRNYPVGETPFTLAGLLTQVTKPAAQLAVPTHFAPLGDTGESRRHSNYDTEYQLLLPSKANKLSAQLVIIVDERSISYSEHSALLLRAAANAVVIGTESTGANGDVTRFSLPGKITVAFSGRSIRHPDGSQLQRKGIPIDIRVPVTIEAIRAGRDDQLDAAIKYAKGQLAK